MMHPTFHITTEMMKSVLEQAFQSAVTQTDKDAARHLRNTLLGTHGAYNSLLFDILEMTAGKDRTALAEMAFLIGNASRLRTRGSTSTADQGVRHTVGPATFVPSVLLSRPSKHFVPSLSLRVGAVLDLEPVAPCNLPKSPRVELGFRPGMGPERAVSRISDRFSEFETSR
jgi:hypothetical protein